MNHDNEIRNFVSREVIYCVSSLVGTLTRTAASEGGLSDGTDYEELMQICVQDDWESPARENGWTLDGDNVPVKYSAEKEDEQQIVIQTAEDWREACEQDNLDPYTVEAYEHWIVTDWMAKRLEEKGEMVAYDICGLTIWGRTTTGQAIYMDSVIQEIYKDLQGE